MRRRCVISRSVSDRRTGSIRRRQVLRQERLMETQHSQHVSDTSAVEADELFTSLGWSDWF